MSRLEVEVGIRGTSAVSQGLDRIQGKVRNWKRDIGRKIAGAFAFGSVIAAFRSTAIEMDRIGKLSKQLNIPIEELQRLGFVAEQNGTGMETMAKGVARLAVNIVEAGQGVKSYQDDLASLGLTYAELAGLSPEEQLKKVADAFNAAEDEGVAFNAVYKLMGRSGKELIPVLKEGSAGIDALGNSISVTSAANVRSIEKFNDAVNKMKRVLMAITGEVLGGMIARTEIAFLKLEAFAQKSMVMMKATKDVMTSIATLDQKGIKKAQRTAAAELDFIDQTLAKKVRVKLAERLKGESERGLGLGGTRRGVGPGDLGEGGVGGSGGSRGARGGGGGAGGFDDRGFVFNSQRAIGGGLGRSIRMLETTDEKGQPFDAGLAMASGGRDAPMFAEFDRLGQVLKGSLEEQRRQMKESKVPEKMDKFIQTLETTNEKIDNIGADLDATFEG